MPCQIHEKYWPWIVCLLVLIALGIRLPNLESRPFHNDEAVNAVKSIELWSSGKYRYDPHEYHGPVLHYATLPFLWLSSAATSSDLNDAQFRYLPVCAGVALVVLTYCFLHAFGFVAALVGALFVAVSPAMVFYSRYFIHEILLLLFTSWTLLAGLRHVSLRSTITALLLGLGLGLMVVTKETFVLTWAALGLAGIFVLFRRRCFTVGKVKSSLTPFLRPPFLIRIVCAASVIWFLLFTSFLANPEGILDSFRTYIPWLTRAGGESPHIHPWNFYFERLLWFQAPKGPVWTEAPVMGFGAIGVCFCCRRSATATEFFVAMFTVLLTVIYTIIAYKTPWCLLSFYYGWILMAGVGVSHLWNRTNSILSRTILIMALILAYGLSVTQASMATNKYAADRKNPYVYAQTSTDFTALVHRLNSIATVAKDGKHTVIKVVFPGHDYWPLPYSLRGFHNVGWFDRLPEDPFAPLVIVESGLGAQLDEKSQKHWIMAGLTEIRPGRFIELYVEFQLWKKYVESLPPITE